MNLDDRGNCRWWAAYDQNIGLGDGRVEVGGFVDTVSHGRVTGGPGGQRDATRLQCLSAVSLSTY